MNIKRNDILDVDGYIGEVLNISDGKFEVLFGGSALNNCVVEYTLQELIDLQVKVVTGEIK